MVEDPLGVGTLAGVVVRGEQVEVGETQPRARVGGGVDLGERLGRERGLLGALRLARGEDLAGSTPNPKRLVVRGGDCQNFGARRRIDGPTARPRQGAVSSLAPEVSDQVCRRRGRSITPDHHTPRSAPAPVHASGGAPIQTCPFETLLKFKWGPVSAASEPEQAEGGEQGPRGAGVGVGRAATASALG